MSALILILLVLALSTTASAWTIRHDRSGSSVAPPRSHDLETFDPARRW